MYLNSMSEFKTIHTLLSYLPPSSCDPSLLHKRTKSSPCLMLANLPALSQLLLVSFSPLSLDFTPKSILSFRSPLEVVQRSFPPPISVQSESRQLQQHYHLCPVHTLCKLLALGSSGAMEDILLQKKAPVGTPQLLPKVRGALA